MYPDKVMLLFVGIVTDFFPEYLTIANLLLFRFNSLSLSRIHLNDEYQGVVSFEVCKNLSPCFSLYVFIIEANTLVPKSIGTSIWYGLSGITKKTQGCVSSRTLM